jgi:hypothetical protein
VAQLCPPVPQFDSQDWDALAQAYIGLIFQYAACTQAHDAAVRAYNGSMD